MEVEEEAEAGAGLPPGPVSLGAGATALFWLKLDESGYPLERQAATSTADPRRWLRFLSLTRRLFFPASGQQQAWRMRVHWPRSH